MSPSFRKMLSDNHRRASRMLGFALHADSSDVWLDAPVVWRTRLMPKERAALAHSVVHSLDLDHAAKVCETVLGGHEMPSVPLLSAIDEAAHWADFADFDSVKACVLAGYNRLSCEDQAAFLNHITGRAAA